MHERENGNRSPNLGPCAAAGACRARLFREARAEFRGSLTRPVVRARRPPTTRTSGCQLLTEARAVLQTIGGFFRLLSSIVFFSRG